MANEYSTLIDPVRSPDNIVHQGYTSEALERALRGEVEFGPPNMRDYGEHNVFHIQNLLETAANPGPWDTLKANLTVPGTETRIFPTAEDQLNMARMSLAMPGTPEYGKATIEQQSAKQLLPVLRGMANQPAETTSSFFSYPGSAQAANIDRISDQPIDDWELRFGGDAGPIEPQGNYIVDMAVDDLAATQNLQKQYPDAAWDLLQHYVRSKGLTEKYSPNMAKTLGLAQEAWNIPMPGQGGFSVDDLLANEAALQGLTPEEAYAAGAFSHTEEKGWKGRGQGIVSEAIKKAEAAGMDVPWTWNVYNRGTDWNVLDEVSELYEKASGGVSGAAEKLQDRIRETGIDFGELGRKAMDFFIPPADAIPAPVEEAGIRRPISPYAVSTGIGTDIVESSPFISSPVVGDEEEEVSEERVKVIKKKPKEKRTSVEEQVVVASEVKKALDNASKGKKVKNELKAIVELAKVDPTIVKRYTTPGSQALQDITAQVDSFSFMPTIQKKKKTVDPWAFEDRRGGRR